LARPAEQVYTLPPLPCIEVLAPDDAVVGLLTKVREYLDFGVEYVSVLAPVSKTGRIHICAGISRVLDGKFKADRIEIDVAPIEP
jgi:hypothetical protein